MQVEVKMTCLALKPAYEKEKNPVFVCRFTHDGEHSDISDLLSVLLLKTVLTSFPNCLFFLRILVTIRQTDIRWYIYEKQNNLSYIDRMHDIVTYCLQ